MLEAAARLERPRTRTRRKVPEDIVLLGRAFEPDVLRQLWSLSDAIRGEPAPHVRALSLLALFSILERSGRALKDGNSIKIVDKKKLLAPLEGFRNAAAKIAADIRSEEAWLRQACRQNVILADARRLPLRRGRFDALITSPPYLNRYDYVRLYSMEEAFGFGRNNAELIALRKAQFRGHVETTYPDHSFRDLSAAAREVCENLRGRRLNNRKILDMVAGYFEDLEAVVRQSRRVLREGAPTAWVVGNVVHGDEHIPVDYFLADALERNGFVVEAILVTRFKGNSSQHMARHGRYPVRESIVVARRLEDAAAEGPASSRRRSFRKCFG